MFIILLFLACSPNPNNAFIAEYDSDSANVFDSGETEPVDSASSVDDEADSSCYPLESINGYTGCYTTRPYPSIDMQLAVQVYGSDFVSWDVTIEAAPEGWVSLNNLGGWLSFHDASGSGWTSDVMGNLSYADQYGDPHAIGVFNSNPGGKSIEVGEIVSAQGDWAVGSVDAGDSAIVTFTLNIEDLNVGSGDWIELDLNSYQNWSSAETSSTESQFGDMVGTRFMFQ